MKDPKTRFTSRVENYVRYRPGYPPEVLDLLRQACGLQPESVIADIGSGSGLLAQLFLDLGCPVYGIEPNAEMRAAGERLLAAFVRFTSVDGSAEHTTLPDGSVDFISAGQAFHRFDPASARVEFKRILRPGGWVILIWNARRVDSTPFLREYEALLHQYAIDYNEVNHRNVEKSPTTIPAFYGGPYQTVRFDNHQIFDFEGLKGRLLSSSYAPEAGHPNHEPMLAALRELYNHHQQDGTVVIEYDTEVSYGRFS